MFEEIVRKSQMRRKQTERGSEEAELVRDWSEHYKALALADNLLLCDRDLALKQQTVSSSWESRVRGHRKFKSRGGIIFNYKAQWAFRALERPTHELFRPSTVTPNCKGSWDMILTQKEECDKENWQQRHGFQHQPRYLNQKEENM